MPSGTLNASVGITLPDVTVLGSIGIDTTFQLDRMPRAGETVIARGRMMCIGGKGANQAAAAAGLGARTTLVGAVGDDQEGSVALAGLEERGVDTAAVTITPTATGSALIYLDAERENSIVVDRGANADVDIRNRKLGGDVLLCQLELRTEVVEAAIAGYDGFVALNAAPMNRLTRQTLERLDLLIVNELEYSELEGADAARRIIVTSGAGGARCIEGGRTVVRVPSRPARVVNTVGAGDAFSAAITVGLAAGMGIVDALEVAVRVGAAAVESPLSQPLLRPFEEYLDGAAAA
jgi:ribokinase